MRESRALGSGPSFFPSGTRILFAGKDESGFSHIYAARVNGLGLTQLTSGPHNDTEPAISPNGRRIAFVSDRNGGGTDIFAMRANGTGIRSLVAAPGNESGPDWAPGGGRIAYASTRGRGPSNVFLAATNGLWIRWLTRCLSSHLRRVLGPRLLAARPADRRAQIGDAQHRGDRDRRRSPPPAAGHDRQRQHRRRRLRDRHRRPHLGPGCPWPALIGVLARSRAEHATLTASLICLARISRE